MAGDAVPAPRDARARPRGAAPREPGAGSGRHRVAPAGGRSEADPEGGAAAEGARGEGSSILVNISKTPDRVVSCTSNMS